MLEVLKIETIEERFFEKYSVQREKSIEWLNQCPISHENTCVQFFGNFEKLSHVFNIETTDIEIIEKLSAAIKQNKGWELYYEKHLLKK